MTGMSWLNRLIRCKRGNTLIVVAAAAPLLIGASAIGVDTIQVALAKRQLQRSADSAAMAGAYSVLQSGSASTAVTRDLTHNNRITLAGAPTIENAPTTGAFAGNARAVRVVLRANRTVPFMSFFTGSTMAVEVEATAAAVPDGTYCVVSLENTSATGVSFGGNTTTDLGCGVATNSTGPAAISVNGSPTVMASPIAAVGGVPPASRFGTGSVTLPYSPPQPDPFAGLPSADIPSSVSSPCPSVSVNPNDTTTLSPGCFSGMDIKGTVTLNPGVYYINGSTLSFGSQAHVTGTGVTFILTSTSAATSPSSIAQIDMNGGAELNLTAPSSGTYSGVLVYQHRNAPLTNQHINGNSTSRIDGAFYMPSTEITFNGNAGMAVQCLRLVGRRVNFSGNSNLVNTCPPNSPNRGFNGLMVRLVG
ncbi:MAG TPA: pilus assembly protein TadG-related protein [Allosphingosinicella sp.]